MLHPLVFYFCARIYFHVQVFLEDSVTNKIDVVNVYTLKNIWIRSGSKYLGTRFVLKKRLCADVSHSIMC